MKKKLAFLLVFVLAVLSFTGCATTETDITLDKTKVAVNYTAKYHISTSSSNAPEGKLEYNNEYTVALDEATGELVISSKADEYWTNNLEDDDKKEGRQIITTLSRLDFTDKIGMPNLIEEEFYVDVEPSFYTYFNFSFDYSLNAGFLKTKEYEQSSETGFKEEVFSVQLTKQFFDKDSIQFIMAAFPESESVIYISSGNRNSLQRAKYEFMEDELVVTDAGTFTCRVVRIRPDTLFSVNSARIYFDKETGIPIQVTHDTSKMILTELNFN